MAEVAKEGFLPYGIFPRITASCFQWKQVTTACAEEDLCMGKDWADFHYGAVHLFGLTNCMEAACIRVDLAVSNQQWVLAKLVVQ
eukprot:3938066-Rhodomonas_salina.1